MFTSTGAGAGVAEEGLGAVEDAEHVHRQVRRHGAGLGAAHRIDRPEHAGVVDPQVDRAEPVVDLGGEALDGVGVGHVDPAGDDVGAVGQWQDRLRAHSPSRCPAAAKASARPAPRPRLAPVTTATATSRTRSW